jgi:putative oxidoreductase
MNITLPAALALAGQILLGGFFIVAAIRNVLNWTKLQGLMKTGPLPAPEAVAAIGIAMQAVGGVSVTFGLWPVAGSAILIVFLILASVMFHPFWKYEGDARAGHLYPCLANTAIAGGLLMVAARALGA